MMTTDDRTSITAPNRFRRHIMVQEDTSGDYAHYWTEEYDEAWEDYPGAFTFDVDNLVDDESIEKKWNEWHERFDDFADELVNDKHSTSGEIMDYEGMFYSRYYENRTRVIEIDGYWIAFPQWYGGGKHGCPWEIDWISDSVYADVTEEVKVVRTWTLA